jgi:hypothetical protein
MVLVQECMVLEHSSTQACWDAWRSSTAAPRHAQDA